MSDRQGFSAAVKKLASLSALTIAGALLGLFIATRVVPNPRNTELNGVPRPAVSWCVGLVLGGLSGLALVSVAEWLQQKDLPAPLRRMTGVVLGHAGTWHAEAFLRHRLRISPRIKIAALAVFCIWFAWNVYEVRQRQSILQFLGTSGATVQPTRQIAIKPWKKLPWMWSVLGATPVGAIRLNKTLFSESDLRHIESLFPESSVMYDR